MRVAIYARTSKQEGEDEGSIPVQFADCRDRAADEGWEVVAEYQDPGVTGWRRKTREQYELLFADAEVGRIDAVLCRDYERLLRNDREGQRWLDLYGARSFRHFKFADEADIDLGRARDRKDWKERVAAAVYYSDRLSEKVRRTKQRQIADGTYTGGERNPFGYRRTARGLEVDPDQAALLHEAVRRLRRGDSLYRVTLDWNAAGITTANGARWRPKTLRRTLTDGHLTGARGYPRILDEAEAAVARTSLEREPTPAPGRPSGRKYPLVGFLHCAECRVKLIGSAGSYRCGPSHGGCGKVSIRATALEQHLLAEAIRRVDRRQPARPRRQDRKTEPILAELRQVEASIEETRELAGSGELRPADAAPILHDLAARQRLLTDELARTLPPPETIPPPLLGWLGSWFAEWRRLGILPTDHPDPDPDFARRWDARELTEAEVLQLREVFMPRLERVTIAVRKRRGKTFDPTRVKVAWRKT
jgi:DNA invertase Pin-like site-specific DNA recombinase